MDDLISILIPSYNHEKFVQETIFSAINQTYKNLELIIIDDGSKDSTFEKIRELESICNKRFVRFELYKQNNKGISQTLNSLLKLVKGEYIIGSASDDIFKPNIIEVLHSFLESNKDYVLAVGDSEIINSDSNPISWGKYRIALPYDDKNGFKTFKEFYSRTKDFSDKFGIFESLQKANYIPNGQLIRHSAIEQTGGYDINAKLEDWYMNLQLSKIGKFKFIDKILFSYRWYKNNSIKKL